MKVMRVGKWLAMAAVFMLLVPGCEFVEQHEKADWRAAGREPSSAV